MQLAYNYFPSAAQPGMLYDAVGPIDIVSRTSSAACGFGLFLVKDTGDGNVLLPSAGPSSSSQVDCVNMYSQFIQSGLSTDGVTPATPAGKVINGLKKGRIWVQCESAFNPDTDSLYLRYTTSGIKLAGMVGNATDSGKNALLGKTGFLVNYTALNTLTAAGLLALDVLIPSAQF